MNNSAAFHDIYLAGPFNRENPAEMEKHYREHCRAAAWLIKSDVALTVFSPTIHNYGIYQAGLDPNDFPGQDLQASVNLALSNSFGRLIIPGHETSIELQKITVMAISLAKPIFNLVPVGKVYSVEHWTPRMEERFLAEINKAAA